MNSNGWSGQEDAVRLVALIWAAGADRQTDREGVSGPAELRLRRCRVQSLVQLRPTMLDRAAASCDNRWTSSSRMDVVSNGQVQAIDQTAGRKRSKKKETRVSHANGCERRLGCSGLSLRLILNNLGVLYRYH